MSSAFRPNRQSLRAAASRIAHVSPLPPQKVFSFWTEFRSFAFQGNLIDLGVGLVLGASFKELTSSLVDNLIMPPIGLLLGNADFSQLFINIGDSTFATLVEAREAGAPVIAYGAFLTDLIDFLIVALSVFLVLRFVLRQDFSKKE